jgi:DNA-binding NarL/FixJ family response regulator
MNCLPGYRHCLPDLLRLVITENTVKYHFRNILDKLHVQNRAQVIAFAVRHDMVEPQE